MCIKCLRISRSNMLKTLEQEKYCLKADVYAFGALNIRLLNTSCAMSQSSCP